MDAPDELVEAVARALFARANHPRHWHNISEDHRETYRIDARAVLSVPALAEVFARDAKVREIVAKPAPSTLTAWVPDALSRFEFIAALYPEAGK